MAKFFVQQLRTYYSYVTVEADTEEEALRHIPTHGDSFKVTGDYYQNEHAEPLEEGVKYFVMKCDVTCLPHTGWILIKESEKEKFIKDWEEEMGWKPSLNEVDFSNIRNVKK